MANRHFWWSVANAKSHLPLKGGIATALQLLECYLIITKSSKLKIKNSKIKTKHFLSQKNPPAPLKGEIATALQLIECYLIITKS